MQILAGQVYAHKKYFKKILEIEGEDVIYHFFDRDSYYYPPNKRRVPVDIDYLQPIEVTVGLKDFLLEIKMRRLQLLDLHFQKNPTLGMPFLRQSRK